MLFHNKKYASALIDFTNLQKGNMHPTDMDGVIEYKDKCYVFIEYKYKDSEMPYGQELAYIRLANDVSPKPAMVIVAQHNGANGEGIIDGGNCLVRKYYTNQSGIWHPIKGTNVKVNELVKTFINKYGDKNDG